MSALDKQHGGSHYKNKAMQPVELWAALNLNGFQASIVKYITRHKEKNGAQDIDKAEHFFELHAELYPARWWHTQPILSALHGAVYGRARQRKVVKHLDRYACENGLTECEEYALRCALLPAFYSDRAVAPRLFSKYLDGIRDANGYE